MALAIYVWKDKTSGKTIEVMKHWDLYREPPTLEEALEQGLTEDEWKAADWTKIVGTTNVHTFNQKGSW